jgi:hypothetical protein
MNKLQLTVGLAVCVLALAGCHQIKDNVDESRNASSNDDGGSPSGDADGDSNPGPDGGTPSTALDPEICARGGHCARLSVDGEARLDLLFVVDNSGSMREEQVALQAQLPNMVRALTSGDMDDDGTQDMPRATDLHVGVVSTDLGLPGISGIPLCEGLGSDGTMVDVRACSPSSESPRFLQYTEGGDRTPTDLGGDLACIASLGTMGCGFEQQLENTLKALWPADDEAVGFLPDPTGFGATGQGGQLGANGNFLRNDLENPSTIAVVLLTDEEDCSSSNMSHFRPDNGTLDPSDPLSQQGLNTRCFFESQLDRDPAMPGLQNNLYETVRYIQALRALRPGAEDRVVFAAIVGVPPDLVEAEDLADVDFASEEGRAFYDGILEDPRMTQVIDDRGTAEVADDNVMPSCDHPNGKAYPPRRIVETVAGFGDNGIVQSICQDDFSPALDVITRRIGENMGAACLAEPLERAAGKVACDVIWELPAGDDCDAQPFLSAHGMRDNDERALCKVEQVEVDGSEVGSGEGFYWDDMSEDGLACGDGGRIQFTETAEPPTGVTVYIDCD